MRDEFNCRIGDCSFRMSESNLARNIFESPLNASDLAQLAKKIRMRFVMCGVVVFGVVFPVIILLLMNESMSGYVFLTLCIIALTALLIAITQADRAVVSVLQREGLHFDRLVLWNTSEVLSLVRPATGSQRVKLADAMQSNPHIGEKIGRFVRLIKEQGREPTALEALFCCARAELYKVEEGVKKADSILDGIALEQKWGSR